MEVKQGLSLVKVGSLWRTGSVIVRVLAGHYDRNPPYVKAIRVDGHAAHPEPAPIAPNTLFRYATDVGLFESDEVDTQRVVIEVESKGAEELQSLRLKLERQSGYIEGFRAGLAYGTAPGGNP